MVCLNASGKSNVEAANSSSGEEEQSGKIRVGKDFQCEIPDWIPLDRRHQDQCIERELLVWSPCPKGSLSDSVIDDYLATAKEKYGYTTEQALGMLFWHQHDIHRSTQDLANFTPFPDEWNAEDKVLFDQAFQFHGKSFHRIRQMIPNKSVGQLVKYYYTWKKARAKTSLMDTQAKTLKDIIVIDDEPEVKKEDKPKCSNCSILCNVTHATAKGQLCGTCFRFYEKHGGRLRPTNSGPDTKDIHLAPRGMYINHDDLIVMANPNQSQNMLKSMDREIHSLKRTIQKNKQDLASLAVKTSKMTIPKCQFATPEINAKWTPEEQHLGVQGIRKLGKDFAAIAEIIGTKNESHVHSFFINYQKRFNLSKALKDFEKGEKLKTQTNNGHATLANDDDNEPEIIELD